MINRIANQIKNILSKFAKNGRWIYKRNIGKSLRWKAISTIIGIKIKNKHFFAKKY